MDKLNKKAIDSMDSKEKEKLLYLMLDQVNNQKLLNDFIFMIKTEKLERV